MHLISLFWNRFVKSTNGMHSWSEVQQLIFFFYIKPFIDLSWAILPHKHLHLNIIEGKPAWKCFPYFPLSNFFFVSISATRGLGIFKIPHLWIPCSHLLDWILPSGRSSFVHYFTIIAHFIPLFSSHWCVPQCIILNIEDNVINHHLLRINHWNTIMSRV